MQLAPLQRGVGAMPHDAFATERQGGRRRVGQRRGGAVHVESS
jgi:hypothetical protein